MGKRGDMKRLLCFAHRGASGHEPENTLAAVKRAVELGADWIEVDVYLVEGELIVIHDERLERTTNGEGYVMDASLSYLRSLDAGKGQTIPTLREVIECVNCRAGINVELKGPGTAIPVVSLIREYVGSHGWTYNHFIVSSFDRQRVKQVKMKDPKVQIGLVLNGIHRRYAHFAKNHQLFSIHPHAALVNDRFMRRARKFGVKVFAYTVNTREEIERLESLGVDGVFTDFPELITQRDTGVILHDVCDDPASGCDEG